MRFEGGAFFGNFDIRQGKDLKTAGVCEGRSVPVSKVSEAASLRDQFGTWRKEKMIGVGEDGLRTNGFHLVDGEGFDSGACSSAYKSWSLDITVWSMDDADAGEIRLFNNIEL